MIMTHFNLKSVSVYCINENSIFHYSEVPINIFSQIFFSQPFVGKTQDFFVKLQGQKLSCVKLRPCKLTTLKLLMIPYKYISSQLRQILAHRHRDRLEWAGQQGGLKLTFSHKKCCCYCMLSILRGHAIVYPQRLPGLLCEYVLQCGIVGTRGSDESLNQA